MRSKPKRIKFSYDYECNVACVICRDKVNRLSEEELKKWDEKIETFFIPMLKDVEVLSLNAAGEVFASRHSRKLIKRVSEKYPKIKYEFLTNGIYCNEQTFKELNIGLRQLHTIRISMHAATKETYSRMVKDGNLYYDKLIENLKYLSRLKRRKNFVFHLNFVVTSLNYRDMPKFVEMAHKYGAVPIFWEYRKTVDHKANSEFYIFEEGHEEYPNLLKVLKHPQMYKYKDSLYPKLKRLQEDDPKYTIKERIDYMLGKY